MKKIFRLSTKSVIFIVLSVVVISAPIVYYFITREEKGDVLGWYNSSWNYKRSITIGNSTGSTLSNEDVLISVDTATLISEGKLQNDCDDLRFVDSDDSTPIDYWIEGGCNTSTTEVWVEIPSLPSAGKTIYMYYANDSATSGELSWSGNYIALFDTSCPTGWSKVTGFDNRLLMGSSAYGNTGGSSTHTHTYDEIPSHSHSGNNLYTSTDGAHRHAIRYAGGSADKANKVAAISTALQWHDEGVASAGSHTHNITGSTGTTGVASGTTDSANHIPPYKTFLLCAPDNPNISVIPKDAISLFESLPSSGYARYTSLDGKFPMVSSTPGSTGGSSTHTHTYSDVVSHSHGAGSLVTSTAGEHTHKLRFRDGVTGSYPYISGRSVCSGWADDVLSVAGAHTHTILGSLSSYGVALAETQSSANLPPYLNMIYGISLSSLEVFKNETIFLFSENPPLGWEKYSSLDNKFPQGSNIYGGTGGSTTHTHVYTEVPSHTHTLGSLATASAGAHTHSIGKYSGVAGRHPYPIYGSASYAWQLPTTVIEEAGDHSHTITGSTASTGVANPTTNSSNHLPPYIEVIFSQRKESETSSVGEEVAYNNSPTSPTNLLTEGETNPNNITDFTPELSAIYNDPDTTDASSYYEIEVNTASDFTGTVMWDSTKTSMTTTNKGNRCPDVTYNGSALSANTTYYWRIKFWDSHDVESPWSSIANFEINRSPTAPTNLLTENETNPNNITDFTPELSAIYDDPDTTDTSSYYEIEVNTASDFTGTVMWDSSKTSMTTTNEGDRSPNITYDGDALSANTTYYWRIKFWDSVDNEGSWSSAANFKINRAPTSPTDLLTEGETNPTTIKDTTPELSAIYDDPDATDISSYYEIEVNTASDFTGTVMWDSGKTSMTTTNEGNRSPDISYAGDTLSTETTYYWRIKFWDSVDNEGTWSDTANFKIDINPTATDLLIIGETNPTQLIYDPYFSAIYTDPNSDDSSAYQIEVNTASNFAGTTMWDSTKTSTTISSGNRSSDITYDGIDLGYDGTTYYVRMKFWDTDDNESDWVTGQFTDTLKSFQFNGLQMNGIQLN